MNVDYILLFAILAVLVVIGGVFYFMELEKSKQAKNELQTHKHTKRERIKEHA